MKPVDLRCVRRPRTIAFPGRRSSRARPLWALLVLAGSLLPAPWMRAQSDLDALRRSFADPPADCRIMMRWWWFGPAVTKPELQRELEQMKSAGIGGVEVATLYPQALDDPGTGFHNDPYLSKEHLDALRFAAEEASRLGLRMDLTLGSGWPLGGPAIPVTQAAGELRVEAVPIPPGADSVAMPPMETGEEFLRGFVVQGSPAADHLEGAVPATRVGDGRLMVGNAAAAPRTALIFIASRTGMQVKRPAVGAEGFVLDHYDARATATDLSAVADRLLQAFPQKPPYAVFSDSLEDYGSDWTPDLVAEFRRRRGYDITPYLPALIGDFGLETAAVRHDWGRTLTQLADENFLQPIQAWAHQHGTLFRSQTYGFPPVTLSSNRYEDLPEGEGKATINMWREFSDTRWAASAGHLFGHNVISSETWTWLHSPAFRATPLDMKAEADLHFLQGINQLVGHGWPYSPPMAGEPGWRMYAAGALNAHNPWFFAMPDLAKYLQRVSFALRQGKPTSDVALLLPNDDVWASFHARMQQHKAPTSVGGFDETGSNVTIDESMDKFLGKEVIAQVLDAGFNVDFIDADAINTVGIPYKVLILPDVNRIPAKTYDEIQAFARAGGVLIATRRLPATAPGLLNRERESAEIEETSRTLFEGGSPAGRFIADERELGSALAKFMQPDFSTSPAAPQIGFIHRRLATGDLYFIANTDNRPHLFKAHFRAAHSAAEEWDPFSGKTSRMAEAQNIPLDLEPYESRLIFLTDRPVRGTGLSRGVEAKTLDLSHDWRVHMDGGAELSFEMPALASWEKHPGLTYYSGTAEYEKTLPLAAADVSRGTTLSLDFGHGTPIPIPDPLPTTNMRAYLEPPVREAAQVFVNGQSAGFVWHPPFRVDLTPFLRAGLNKIRIEVGNTAINSMAGRSQPDYRLLDDLYGVRFIPQGMDNLKPLPSGILGGVTLVESRPVR